jgi:hypothetical protein
MQARHVEAVPMLRALKRVHTRVHIRTLAAARQCELLATWALHGGFKFHPAHWH